MQVDRSICFKPVGQRFHLKSEARRNEIKKEAVNMITITTMLGRDPTYAAQM